MKNKLIFKKTVILLFWILMWEMLALAVNNALILVTPGAAAGALLAALISQKFWIVVGMTLLKISAGFLAGVILGVVIAFLCKKLPLAEEVLEPVIHLMKAIPVVSFVVMFLIWWGSSFLAVIVTFLMVFPIIYRSTLEGIKATDRSMLEMAEVFGLPVLTRIFYLYRPQLRPFLLGSIKTAAGLAWKSGVAAEVIGLPAKSIGEQIYFSKITLDTAGIIAWTVVVIVFSRLFEKLVLALADGLFRVPIPCMSPAGRQEVPGSIACHELQKIYDGKNVLQQGSLEVETGEIHWLTGASGSGKTTLLRVVAGLETADGGYINGDNRENGISMLFQEERLCLEYSALRNVAMVTGDIVEAKRMLEKLLDEKLLDKPCKLLSGGEKRRVALARALASKSGIILLDEPFAGLDQVTIQSVWQVIKEERAGRTVLIASHILPKE